MMYAQQRSIRTGMVADLLNTMNQRHVISISHQASFKSAAEMLESNIIGAVMVMDSDKKHIGILTSRDIQSAVANNELKHLGSLKAANLMTAKANLCIVSPEDSLQTVATTMQRNNIRHIPVYHNDDCVAMLSVKDVIGEVLRQERDATKAMQTVVTDSFVNSLKK